MVKARAELARGIAFEKFVQFKFAQQWAALRAYARQRGVGLLGDMPIFVAFDSADVWAHRELFRLDSVGRPLVVSGVPRITSPTANLGHPHYRVGATRGRFRWWWPGNARLFAHLTLCVDQFLGFQRMWKSRRPAAAATDAGSAARSAAQA